MTHRDQSGHVSARNQSKIQEDKGCCREPLHVPALATPITARPLIAQFSCRELRVRAALTARRTAGGNWA